MGPAKTLPMPIRRFVDTLTRLALVLYSYSPQAASLLYGMAIRDLIRFSLWLGVGTKSEPSSSKATLPPQAA